MQPSLFSELEVLAVKEVETLAEEEAEALAEEEVEVLAEEAPAEGLANTAAWPGEAETGLQVRVKGGWIVGTGGEVWVTGVGQVVKLPPYWGQPLYSLQVVLGWSAGLHTSIILVETWRLWAEAM